MKMTTGNFKAMQSKPQLLHSTFIVQLFDFQYLDQFFLQIRSLGIEFTASAMDVVSVDFLHSINVPFIKVTNQQKKTNKQIIFYQSYKPAKHREFKLYSGWLRRREPFSVTQQGIAQLNA